MPLPLSFLLGLVLYVGGDMLWAGLPLPAVPLDPLLLSLAAVPLAYFAGWCYVLAAYARLRANRSLVPLAPLCPGVMLAVWALILGYGQLQAVVDQALSDSETLRLASCLGPLALLELLNTAGQVRGARGFQYLGVDLRPAPLRLRIMMMMLLGVLLFGVVQDLSGLQRDVLVFSQATTLGVFSVFALLVLMLVLLMPPVVVFCLPTSRRLPVDAERTACLLGFAPRRLRLLHSEDRVVNAGLLGPIPGLRYLLLSDGLVRLLDPISLRGVVAHEVGHARAAHPLWLVLTFLGIPALLYLPLEWYLMPWLGESGLVVLLAVLGVLAMWAFRRIGHRFEHEADQISSAALGGAGPCIIALQSISDRFDLPKDKASMRHPSEEARIQHLLWWDGDPQYRERFARAGQRLRRGILLGLLLAGVLSVFAHREAWRLDRPYYELYTGRFAAAEASVLALADIRDALPERHRESLRMLEAELDAARSLLPAGGAWPEIRAPLAARAAQRAQQLLRDSGPAAARPWLALALVAEDAGPELWCWYEMSRAAQAQEADRVLEVRDHLLRHYPLSEAQRQMLRLLVSTG